jgi:hypothetical protein
VDATPEPDAGATPAAGRSLGADAVLPVGVGTLAWLVALVVVVIVDGAGRPTAVCAVGAGLGVLGLWQTLRRRAAYRRAGRQS